MPQFAGVPAVEAAPEDVGMSSQRLGNVTRLVQGYVDEGRYAGAVTLVARRDKVVHLETYGQMDAERGLAMRPDTVFRIYSMTKPIASVGLMALYERGLFQLNDPIGAHLPELAGLSVFDGGTADDYRVREAGRQVTVRDVLMHTSGMAGSTGSSAVSELYRRAGVGDPFGGLTLAEAVRRLGELPLAADPGTRWIYGLSTDVVGRLCEVLSGLPFEEYLRRTLFEPLGMPDTGFHVRPEQAGRFAASYLAREVPDGSGDARYTLSEDPAASPYLQPCPYPSGTQGLVSTAGDYLRFCRMLTRGGELDGERIIGARTLAFMTANHLPGGQDLVAAMAKSGGESQREGHGFGLGFGVLLDPTVSQTIGTAGEYFWGGMASTAFFVSPQEDLVTIFLTQLRPSATYPIRRQLRATVYSAITG